MRKGRSPFFGLKGFSAGLILLASACRSAGPPSPLPVWTNYQINASVFALEFDGDYLWVGTDQGLIKYDLAKDEIIARFNSKNSLPLDIVRTIAIDPHKNVWVGTHGGGLARYDGAAWTHYGVPDLADPYVYDIKFDPSGRMWVANWKGVSVFDGTGWKSYTKADGIIDDWVYALAIDRAGVVWMGTEGGVTRYDGGGFVSYSHKDGVGADLKAIGDFEKLRNPSFHHQTTPGKEAEGYNPNYILAAAVDSNDTKWFGTWGAGLSRFDGKKWTNFTTRDGLAGNFVTDILADKDGTLYVTTDGGISLFSAGRWRTYSTKDGLVNDGVFTAAVDGMGYKWFGTLAGISKLDGFLPGGGPRGS